jgi:predicted ester cyclase
MRRYSVFVSLVAVVVLGSALHLTRPLVAAQEASPAAGTPCPATSEDANEALVRRFYQEAWNQGHVEFFDEAWAPTAAINLPVTQGTTRDAMKARILEFRRAFPDLRLDVTLALTEGDSVIVGVDYSGTQLGEFDGIPPTGRAANWTALELFRIECGKIVFYLVQANALDLRRDLGIITDEELATVATPAATPQP